MTIEFGDSEDLDVPVVGSEFAEVSVRFDVDGNAPRVRLEDLRSGRVRYLDALELVVTPVSSSGFTRQGG
jgi:hypothetical protein